jgi:hypothetical protein
LPEELLDLQTTIRTLHNTLLAKAEADDCFVGIEEADLPIDSATGECPQGSIPRTSGGYVWGMTQEGDKVWLAILPNPICLVGGGLFGLMQPFQTDSFVCEFGQSDRARADPSIPDQFGDWRPPSVFVYDLSTGELSEDMAPVDDPLLFRTVGLRSAGSLNDIVFVAGLTFPDPVMSEIHLAFFAFQSSTGEYLGSCEAPAFNDIRKWLDVGGVLYAGVGTSTGGAVIRWNGDINDVFDEDDNCGFEVVGIMEGGNAAELSVYGNDRIAVSAWPTLVPLATSGAGIWISPPFGSDGSLTDDDAGDWRHVWSPLDYDPDPVIAATNAGGAVAYYDGWLYWGTMHVPGIAAIAHASCNDPDICFGPPETEEEQISLQFGTWRATSVWRGRDLETASPQIQLLYGESLLPAYDSAEGAFLPSPTGWSARYGHSGFNNPFNHYTWAMAILDRRLFVGTLDTSFLELPQMVGDIGVAAVEELGLLLYGADLWRFNSSRVPAVPEDLTGVGNFLNYGIRSMITQGDGSALLIGTANPFNLEEEGGWEFRRLSRQ